MMTRVQGTPGIAGIVLNLAPMYPDTDTPEDREAAKRRDGYFNCWFLDPIYGRGYPQDMLELLGENAPEVKPGDYETIAKPIDFLGINYYMPWAVAADSEPFHKSKEVYKPEYGLVTAKKTWVINPEGLHSLLKRLSADYPVKSMYITENGASYHDEKEPDGSIKDQSRTDYIREHLKAIQKSKEEGIPVDGYFSWSLMDNLEWTEGYGQPFGIIYVDRKHDLKRTIKDSGRHYAAFIKGEDNKFGE